MTQRPLIIAHRGASGLAPENTLAAFAKAIEIGVDRLEMDLRQTIDGEVVVIHDKTIMRTTNGWGSVRKLSLKNIQKYSAGSWFHYNFSSEKVPTFREVLKLVNGQTKLLLEVKEGSPYHHNIERNILNLINEFDAHKWCIVQSFNDKVLENFRELPNLNSDVQKLFEAFIPVAPFYGGSRFSYKRIRSYGFAEEVNINYRYVTPLVVRKVHELGKKVNVWTVNQPENLVKYTKMGVDGIITDYPDRLRQALGL
ncbi:MAG: glycerophosphodiester phosphodiesterase [Bacteroidetes bacterium]|nr:MAG: glycerophosphodiester phosphodiesterase [Bacteroidota bacterium]MBL1144805.1 glycerophosphodiester phosphodiesterase [Bacteroidota bacterium]NOG57599.1 glycerophosphodiester phosphodiesterase [Bacteroidota bacterium]